MKRDRIARSLFVTIALSGTYAAVFAVGMYAAHHNAAPYRVAALAVQLVASGLGSLFDISIVRPDHLIQPARYEGEGVTINRMPANTDLILLSGFFGQDHELRLIQRDGTLVRRWILVFSELFPDGDFLPAAPVTRWNVDTHGALAMPDGSVVFNFEYSGSAALDRCGAVLWTLKRQSHHSVTRAEQGGFWIPGSRLVTAEQGSRFPPFEAPFVESTAMLVSERGEVLHEISIEQLFYDNGLEAVLTAAAVVFQPRSVKAWHREIVHVNKIAELSSELAPAFPMFSAGDLLLSFRNLNLLMVFAPDTGKVKWWRTGPWLRQHDPEFAPGGAIVVFNNNTHLELLPAADRTTNERRSKCPASQTSSVSIPRRG